MIAWLKALCADAQGIPDELRAAFVLTIIVYLLLWVIWFAFCGGWATWPDKITPFVAGAAGITAAFGLTVRGRGSA